MEEEVSGYPTKTDDTEDIANVIKLDCYTVSSDHMWPQSYPPVASMLPTCYLKVNHLWPQSYPPVTSKLPTCGLKVYHLLPQSYPPEASKFPPSQVSLIL